MGIPSPIARSTMIARSFSALVIAVDFNDAIWYRRRFMQSEAAGIPTLCAMMMREDISHHIGATFMALWSQMIELMK